MDYKVDLNKMTVKKKIEQVKTTIEEMKKYKTIGLLKLSKLPDALLQSLRKKVRDNGGKVLILKKPVVTRVLESDKKLKETVSECEKPVGLILTNQSPFELNTFFKQQKKKRAAKIGDIATSDLVIPEGETDLPPGPALSELKAGGVNVQIKGGKIVVAKDSTVAKSGETITEQKAKALQTLGVMPFEINAELIFGFDGEYIYTSELFEFGDNARSNITNSISQAFNLSMNTGYPTQGNIDLLLTDALRQSINFALNAEVYSSSSIEQVLCSALRQGTSLESLAPAEEKADAKEEPKEEKPKEEKAEEKKDDAKKEEQATGEGDAVAKEPVEKK